jgi:type III secretion system YscQ/HrcQ family protein
MHPIKLPRLEKPDALALNRLYGSAPAVSGDASLTWVKKNTPFAERAWLEIVGDARTAWLLLDSPAALGTLLKGPIGHMPEIDRIQAIEAYCTGLLDLLEESFGFALDVVKAGLGSRSALSQSMAVEMPHSAASMVCAELEWQAEHMTEPVRCQLRMPYDWLHSYRRSAAPSAELRPGGLALEISLQCGWTELTALELKQLQPGSWIRLRHNYGTDNGWLRRLRVCSKHINWSTWADMDQASRLLVVPALASAHGQSDSGNVFKTSNQETANTMNFPSPENEDASPQNGSHAPAAQTSEADLGQDIRHESALAGLALKVVFEVGTADIALDALLELKPGYTIDLNRPIDPLGVRLLVNGGEVATGELTDIGGVLGVLVTSVHSRLLRG